jgi:8-oxo-dGTP pyrophosphatase MutT (NUDIX family)
MTEEFSAGGIVLRQKDGSRVEPGMTIEILVSQHSQHHGWVFPKGHVGDTIKDETPEEGAIREVQEETGIVGKILQKLTPVDYWYVFEGEKRHKTVVYFTMEYESGNIKDHGWEMENVEWLPIEKVEERLTFASDKKAWTEARQLIANST